MATPEQIVDHKGLSKKQIDLIQQFEADFNVVERFLRVAVGGDKHLKFVQLVQEYANRYTAWGDAELLRTIAKIRNVIVHDKTEPFRYIVIPTSSIAEELRKCRERLINPSRAIPTFERTVEIVSISDTLTRVLKIIDIRDYSQSPVYEGERFRGLLTENGVTRWLAGHVSRTLSLAELDVAPVGQVLKSEEERKNYQFVSRDTRVDDIRASFAAQTFLEAVLVTTSGEEAEKLLGIATRWDMLQLA